jgi:hypothetical protein
LGSFPKNKVRKSSDERQIFTLQVDRRFSYPMQPWFYYPFKGERDGLPKYKAHWNFIQSNTRMLVERTFGILKGRFRILFKKVNIPLCHMLNLVMACICLHNICITNLDGFDMD